MSSMNNNLIQIHSDQFALSDFHLDINDIETAYRSKATVGYGDNQITNDYRTARWISLTEEQRSVIKEAIKFYLPDSTGIEEPQLVSYSVGERYGEHNDSEELINGEWKRVTDRDFTIIFYLNDNYQGGELVFPKQGVTISPKAGSVVIFPSDHRYPHEVIPVKEGIRYAIVSWVSNSCL